MKAQISTEYLFIVGLALFLTIPTVVIFFTQSADAIDHVNGAQCQQILRKIVENAEKVYYLGSPTSTTLKAVFPKNVHNITIANRYIAARLKTDAGYVDYIESSAVNLSGNLAPHSGVMKIRVENLGGVVNVSYVP